VVPRFTSNPLYSRRAPFAHWWASNIGLATLVIGFVMRARGVPAASALMAAGATLAAAGAYIFAYVIWRTIDGTAGQKAAAERAAAVASAAGARPRLPIA
jgi:cbb3-type cytochrome oxidase subunit 1